ncbi:tetratricopeptide repeat protein [Sulfurihydrogenibium sp.]|uniref:tetratricopeptide repeat protein n=1 Tax=Sulfurihydrogenibium sp. TaxID=2053621 RepID=UPI00260F2CF2|nr:tetratricopeptide repeat protein [Sulfurihydrogenibium sp.]
MKKIIYLVAFLNVFNIFGCAGTQNVDYPYQETSSNEGRYLYDMGVSYLTSGNNAMAISYLEKAIQTYKNPDVYNSLALAYQFAGEFTKAEIVFKEGLERYPNSPELLTNYGILLAIQKRYNDALNYLKKAENHTTYQRKEIVFFNMALIYKDTGKEDLFLEYMNKAIMYNSNYLNAYTALGDYYYEKYLDKKDLSYLKFAREYYAKALTLSLNDPVIYFKLGKVYRDLGQIDLAKFYLEKALKSSQENKQLQEEIRKTLLDMIENTHSYEKPIEDEYKKQETEKSNNYNNSEVENIKILIK